MEAVRGTLCHFEIRDFKNIENILTLKFLHCGADVANATSPCKHGDFMHNNVNYKVYCPIFSGNKLIVVLKELI